MRREVRFVRPALKELELTRLDRQIPTVLSYIDGEEYHGTQAKAQLVRNSANTVAYFRDYLGKQFKDIDPTPCHQSAHPQQSDSTIAFSIRDTASETPQLRHCLRDRYSASAPSEAVRLRLPG